MSFWQFVEPSALALSLRRDGTSRESNSPMRQAHGGLSGENAGNGKGASCGCLAALFDLPAATADSSVLIANAKNSATFSSHVLANP